MPERSEFPRRADPASYILARRWATWTVGASIAALGFVVVLWLTEPAMPPLAPGATILANATVSDATSLMGAVQTAGLRGAPDVKGAIEEMKRLDNERVTIKGWAVDTAAAETAMTVLGFAGGIHAFTTVTSGANKDVAQTLGLSQTSAPNVAFQGTFKCGQGQKLVVVAITPDRRYGHFRSITCP